MPTMELSSGFVPGYLSRQSGNANYNFHESSLFYIQTVSGSFIATFRILKGTMPTDFSTLTNINTSRSSDVLLQHYVTSGSSLGITMSVNTSANPLTLSSILVNASASGTATWFWYAQGGNNTIPFQQFIGTVGLSGSGSDLEIDSVNIVSGNAYKFTNLKIQLPTSWTW